MAPWRALDELGPAIAGPAAAVVVADLDWGRFGPRYAEARHRPLVAELVPAAALEPDRALAAADLARMPPDAAEAALRALVTGHVAVALGQDPADLAADRDFAELGLDSLRALELRNRLARDLGRRLPITLALEHPTPAALARFLFETLTTAPPEEERP
jgi:acyl carrier protein